MAGKFNRGYLDLTKRSLPTGKMLMPKSVLSGWFKSNYNINDEPVLFSANGIRLMRNNNKIAVHQESTKKCILWNKLGSQDEAEHSEIGGNAAITGAITYSPGKFGNGVLVNSGSEKVDISPNLELKTVNSHYTVELWLTTNWDISNGTQSTGRTCYCFVLNDGSMSEYITLRFLGTYVNVLLATGAGSTDIRFTDSLFTWNAGVCKHIAVVFNRDNARKFAVYVDGKCATPYYYIEDNYLVESPFITCTLGTTPLVGVQYIDGVIDNFKVWNYAKTDFSDRNIEDAANFIEGDAGLPFPNDDKYHHYAMRVNLDRTYDLFLDGVKEYSSVMKIPEECFIDWEDRLKPSHWYKFDEPIHGSTSYDSGTVGGVNGVDTGTIWHEYIGKQDKCYYNNGTARYLTFTSSDFSWGSNDFTISCWTQHLGPSGHRYLLAGDADFTWLIGTSATGPSDVISLWLGNGTSAWSEADDVYGTTILLSTGWYHIVLTRNGDNFKVYVNNIVEIEVNVSASYSIPTTAYMNAFTIASGIYSGYWNGFIDDIRIYNGRGFSAEEVKQLYNLTNTYFLPKPKLSIGEPVTGRLAKPYTHWPLNERSGNTVNDIAGNSSATLGVDTTLGKLGPQGTRCYDLDSSLTTTRIDIPDSFLPVGTEITLSFWAYTRVQTNANSEFITGDIGGTRNFMLTFPSNTGPTINFDCGSTGASYDRASLAWDISWYNTWTHWVFTKDSTAGIIRFFRNGQLIHATTGDTHPILATTNSWLFGQDTAQEWNGKASDIRIYDFSVTDEEVRQLYTMGRTPIAEVSDVRYDRTPLTDFMIKEIHDTDRPTDEDEELKYKHINENEHMVDLYNFYKPNHGWTLDISNGLIDYGTDESATYALSNNGATSGAIGRIEEAYSFNGSSNYMRIITSFIFPLNGKEFTYSMWLNPVSLPANASVIGFVDDAYNGYYWRFTNTGQLDFVSNNIDRISTSGAIVANTWNFITITGDGNFVYQYVNGVLRGSWEGTPQDPVTSAQAFFEIGRVHSVAGQYVPGRIDDVRIYNRVFSDQEVKGLYDYTNNYNTKVTNITKLISHSSELIEKKPLHWWKLDKDIIENSGLSNVEGTNYGAVKRIGASHKEENCYEFDGVSAYIESGSLLLGKSDFTITLWVKTTDNVGSFIANQYPSSPYGGIHCAINSINMMTFNVGWGTTTGAIYTTRGISDGEWHHLAFVFNGADRTGWAIYIDGIKEVTAETGSDLVGSGIDNITPITIGNRALMDYSLKAQMSDVQIFDQELTVSDIKKIYEKGIITSVLGDYAYKNYSNLLNKDKIKAINKNAFKDKVIVGLSKTTNEEGTLIITAEDF